MDQVLKSYKYISDTKVDVLYSQIPRGALEGIAVELNINLKLAIVETSAAVKRNLPLETRYSRLQVVIKYLEKHQQFDIGTIDAPKAYFRGVLPMHWRLIPPPPRDQTKLVYWGGSTEQTILGLGGSPQHMIGRTGDATIGEPSSALPYLVAFLAEHLRLASPPEDADPEDPLYGLDAVKATNESLKGSMPRFEFLAEFLLDDSDQKRIPGHKRILIGSPIYVALAKDNT
jgi:hypothetical protein